MISKEVRPDATYVKEYSEQRPKIIRYYYDADLVTITPAMFEELLLAPTRDAFLLEWWFSSKAVEIYNRKKEEQTD